MGEGDNDVEKRIGRRKSLDAMVGEKERRRSGGEGSRVKGADPRRGQTEERRKRERRGDTPDRHTDAQTYG